MAGRSTIRRLRDLMAWLASGLAVVSFLLLRLDPECPAAAWVFTIALSAAVGFWTNSIALTMLFRPLQRTAFGRQGLIPRHREQLAEVIGAAVAEDLLDPQSVIAFVRQHRIVEEAARELLAKTKRFAADQAHRQALVHALVGYLKAGTMQRSVAVFDAVATRVRTYVEGRITSEVFWEEVQNALGRELEKPGTAEALAASVHEVAGRNTATIAGVVNSFLDDWIESNRSHVAEAVDGFLPKAGGWLKDWFGQAKTGVLKRVKGALHVDEERLRQRLDVWAQSDESKVQVQQFVRQNLGTLRELASSAGAKGRILVLFDDCRDKFRRWVDTEGMPLATQELEAYLDSDAFWNAVDRQVPAVVDWAVGKADDYMKTEAFANELGVLLQKLALALDVKAIVQERVNAFDPSRLERLVRQASGDNLSGIELFGGVLGALAGLVLVDWRFAPLLLLLGAAYWGAETLAGHRV